MPIILNQRLPAFKTLLQEGVPVITTARALSQDIRPLRIALLNLMPDKLRTELQFARLIGSSPIQVDLHLIRITGHSPRNSSMTHLNNFYETFSDVASAGDKFDGLIITGAPLEHIQLRDVSYWSEMKEIFGWLGTNVHSTLGVCWGAMAMASHFYGMKTNIFHKKIFGCYRHTVMTPASPYVRGFSDEVFAPVSRWSEVDQNMLLNSAELKVISVAEAAGVAIAEDVKRRMLYVFSHFEYDRETLHREYARDLELGKAICKPCNYYAESDGRPQNRWSSHAHLLFANWLDMIYQTSFYDIDSVGNYSY